MLLAAFALLSLLLASIGLYGVMASAVGQRTREIGVRAALGATRAALMREVLEDAARLLLVGAALGLAASVAATRVMAGLLFEIRPTDLATLSVATLVLSAVGILAAYLPARRAARLDPVQALRAE
jgi:putative ABC transport system permease protein